jgi:hypothetical protein
MFIWGWGSKSIGQYTTNIDCSHCANPGLILVAFQKFFDIFYIPTIPLKKYYSLACSNCETHFQAESFNIELDSTFKVKTPWWGYSGLLVISILIVGIFCLERSDQQQKLAYLEAPHVNDLVVLKIKELKETPYTFAKIKKIEGDIITLTASKYAFSKLRQAQRESHKASINNDFSDDILEVSLEDFKKMDIESINRFG